MVIATGYYVETAICMAAMLPMSLYQGAMLWVHWSCSCPRSAVIKLFIIAHVSTWISLIDAHSVYGIWGPALSHAWKYPIGQLMIFAIFYKTFEWRRVTKQVAKLSKQSPRRWSNKWAVFFATLWTFDMSLALAQGIEGSQVWFGIHLVLTFVEILLLSCWFMYEYRNISFIIRGHIQRLHESSFHRSTASLSEAARDSTLADERRQSRAQQRQSSSTNDLHRALKMFRNQATATVTMALIFNIAIGSGVIEILREASKEEEIRDPASYNVADSLFVIFYVLCFYVFNYVYQMKLSSSHGGAHSTKKSSSGRDGSKSAVHLASQRSSLEVNPISAASAGASKQV